LPFAAGTFVVAGLASMGMPGFSGFVAEFQVLIGAWKAFPTLAVLAGVGVLVGVAYTLRAMQKAFFSASDLAPTSAELAGAELAGAPAPALEPVGTMGAMGSGHVGPSHSVAAARAGEWPERAALGTGSSGPGHSGHGLGDISIPERLGATLLIALTLLIGVYPRLLLDWIEPALHSPLMEQVLKAGDR
ncbi:MAG TPA: hypothetical protein VNM37_01925, partial [Candidatus Dormibacteraeota bacterium]|nr:hypothetical protein [Candidatus Dormibacteraeota bacterium]